MITPITVSMTLSVADTMIPCSIADFSVNLEADIAVSSVTPYMGPYQLTPTAAVQIIPIDHKMAMRDIVINPVPSNYGLITWDGSTLTVS